MFELFDRGIVQMDDGLGEDMLADGPGTGKFAGRIGVALARRLTHAAEEAVRLGKKYRQERRVANDDRAARPIKAPSGVKRVPLSQLNPPARPPMDQGPKYKTERGEQPTPRDPTYQFPNYKYPVILADGRSVSADGEGLPIVSILTKDNMKTAGQGRFVIEKKVEELFPGHTKAQLEGYDRGHIHGDAHNGRPDLAENFVPIRSDLNQDLMAKFEIKLKKLAVDENKQVEYRRHFIYDPSETVIPKFITLEAYVDGKLVETSGSHLNWIFPGRPY